MVELAQVPPRHILAAYWLGRGDMRQRGLTQEMLCHSPKLPACAVLTGFGEKRVWPGFIRRRMQLDHPLDWALP